jgi:alkyl hydroperoxide reductase subunit AhpC
MSELGKVRIGHKAPDFHCDAVINGLIEGSYIQSNPTLPTSILRLIFDQEKSLGSYISPSKPQWLILLFIPAALSFDCPTEVITFQHYLNQFRDRNCDVVFVSVDTKHLLWHWQNVPQQHGGLGQTDIALLSDASHKMSRDYGVLIEERGDCLRGLFLLDDKAIVQQVCPFLFSIYPT